jgi:hypothetical protein
MAETYKKIFIDGQTGEQRIEEFTPEEVTQKEADIENAKIKTEAFQTKLKAKEDDSKSGNQKLLDLGLTQAEATALTGYTPPSE